MTTNLAILLSSLTVRLHTHTQDADVAKARILEAALVAMVND